ncbi:MAG: HD-GYP domain-containing protein [Oscillospiraceae bacterium]
MTYQKTLLVYHDLVAVIVASMEARDQYTVSHSLRVSDMAEKICFYMGIEGNDIENIHIAAHVHDIGKIGVPDNILLKPGALTDAEWIVMKNHSTIGYEILHKVTGFEEIATIVRHHHERFNGNGYPDSIAGETIPLGSRIIAIADSIDAMLSDRKYRKGLSANICKLEIEKNKGIMYDPRIASVVLNNWDFIVDM